MNKKKANIKNCSCKEPDLDQFEQPSKFHPRYPQEDVEDLGFPEDEFIEIRKLPQKPSPPGFKVLTTFAVPKTKDEDLPKFKQPTPIQPPTIQPLTTDKRKIVDLPTDTKASLEIASYEEAAKKGNESNRRIDRTTYGLNKQPKDGKYVTYIFSYEVLNTILAKGRGRSYGDSKKMEITAAMNSSQNIQMKSNQECDGYASDIVSDTAIMNAINAANPEDKKLTNKKYVNRLSKIWQIVQTIDLPPQLKQLIENQLNQIKDKDGNDII